MLLNLWETDTLTQNFMNLYNLTRIQMCNTLRRLHTDSDSDSVSVFCEETGIKLDKLDVSDNVEFVGKIVSTTTDDFNYIKKVGLVPVDVLLETKSPISCHLDKYQIAVKPSEHKIFYKGKPFNIPPYGDNCEWCAYGDEQCRFDDKKYKNMYCPFLEAIEPLAIKLYRDKAEIEMFLMASIEEMLRYSTVRDYPEIFVTIENFMRDFLKKNVNIGSDWADYKQHTFIVTVNVKYNDMSYRNNYTDGSNGVDATDTYLEYERFCLDDYDYAEEVPKCFWDNIWIIRTCLNRICACDVIHSEICAGLKHNISFPYETIKIDLV